MITINVSLEELTDLVVALDSTIEPDDERAQSLFARLGELLEQAHD